MLVIVTALAFTGMAQPAHVSVNTTVGFLLENIGRVYRKLENRLPSGVSGYTVIFPAHSPTLLKQAAKQMSEDNVDILVGYNSYVGLHQLHQIAGAGRGHNSSRMLEMSAPREMNWYLRLERSRLPRGCVDRHVMSAVVGCGSLQATANALAAVITQLRWKHLSLLYHPDHELMSSLMLNSLSGAGVIVQHYSINNRSAVEAAINSSSAMLTDRDMNFMLFANQGFSKTVFQTLSGMQHGERTTLTLFSRWLIWGNDIDPASLSNAINQISNVAVFQQLPCDRFKMSSAPVEEMSTILLKRAIALAQRKTLDKACLTGSTPDIEAYKLFLAFQDLIACEECQSNPRFSISSAMWKPSGRSFELVISGDSLSELNATEDRVFPNIAFGLNNITLFVATLAWSPFVMRHEEDGRNVYEGFSMDLLHEMALLLNFSYTVYEPADMEWGRIDDGRWTGLVGEMKRRKGDMAVAALSIQPEREEVMDFISAYFTDYTVILLKKPDENWAKWRTLIDPFQTFVIVAIIACLPVVSLVLTFCERVSPCYKNITNRHRYPGLHNYSDCFWYLLGALLTQGGIYLPKSQSSRTITGFWWLFSIIVVATYSGNLIASLTVVRDNVPINTVEELVEQSTYKWGTTNGTYINMMLQTTKDPIYRKLWAGIKEFEKDDPDVLNINHGLHIQRVKQGKYAYFNDLSSMLSETLKDCTLAYADEQFLPLHFAIGLQENSPYRAIFDEQMLAISESGLLNIWKRRWWPRNSTCVGLQIRQSKPISIFDVQSAYYLLLAGVTVAIISMVGETVRRVCAKKSPLQM